MSALTRSRRLAVVAAVVALVTGLSALVGLPTLAASSLGAARSSYVEHCAGCHGIQGSSAPAQVPQLRGRVGHFLCTAEGRAYLIRLPNVSHAPISNNEELAELMNFVVFGLGGASAPEGALRFDAAEVARLRKEPLTPGASLVRRRRKIVDGLIRTCSAPADLRGMYGALAASRPAKEMR